MLNLLCRAFCRPLLCRSMPFCSGDISDEEWFWRRLDHLSHSTFFHVLEHHSSEGSLPGWSSNFLLSSMVWASVFRLFLDNSLELPSTLLFTFFIFTREPWRTQTKIEQNFWGRSRILASRFWKERRRKTEMKCSVVQYVLCRSC